MGRHKALLDWNGEPIIRAHCRTMTNAGGQVIVVLGAEVDRIQAVLPEGVQARVNVDWANTQMADSLRAALEGLTGGALVTPVDVPPAPRTIIDQLVNRPHPTVACHNGVDGHPVWIHADRAAARLGTETLADILTDAERVEVDWPGCTVSWNTPQEWSAQSSD